MLDLLALDTANRKTREELLGSIGTACATGVVRTNDSDTGNSPGGLVSLLAVRWMERTVMRSAFLITVALGTAAAAWGCGGAPMDEDSSNPSDPGAPSETRAAGEQEGVTTTEEALRKDAGPGETNVNEDEEDLGQTKDPLWGGWGGGGWGGGFRPGVGWGGGWWGGGWRGGWIRPGFGGGWWGGGGWITPGVGWGGGWWGRRW